MDATKSVATKWMRRNDCDAMNATKWLPWNELAPFCLSKRISYPYRIAYLYPFVSGTLKWVEKAGVSQCDVDLKFQTKRLTSKLFGYISKTESSLGTDFKVDYAFVNTQPQWIKFYFIYANRSPASYFSFFSNSTLETTAYPQFNYKSSLIFKVRHSHILISATRYQRNYVFSEVGRKNRRQVRLLLQSASEEKSGPRSRAVINRALCYLPATLQ